MSSENEPWCKHNPWGGKMRDPGNKVVSLSIDKGTSKQWTRVVHKSESVPIAVNISKASSEVNYY